MSFIQISLQSREHINPVTVRVLGDVVAESELYVLVFAFRLPISLWMIGCRYLKTSVKALPEALLEC